MAKNNKFRLIQSVYSQVCENDPCDLAFFSGCYYEDLVIPLYQLVNKCQADAKSVDIASATAIEGLFRVET